MANKDWIWTERRMSFAHYWTGQSGNPWIEIGFKMMKTDVKHLIRKRVSKVIWPMKMCETWSELKTGTIEGNGAKVSPDNVLQLTTIQEQKSVETWLESLIMVNFYFLLASGWLATTHFVGLSAIYFLSPQRMFVKYLYLVVAELTEVSLGVGWLQSTLDDAICT